MDKITTSLSTLTERYEMFTGFVYKEIISDVACSIASASLATKIIIPVGNIYSFLATTVTDVIPWWIAGLVPMATALFILTKCYVAIKRVNYETSKGVRLPDVKCEEIKLEEK